jgi:helix-hairpin-helix protein
MKSNQWNSKFVSWGLMWLLASGLTLFGCTTSDHKPTADEVREKTAETTAELKRNAKSVAEGVKEGWSRDKERVDLNSATREQLVGTGLTRTQSDRVIEHRPYTSTRELLTKHVLSEDEYREIAPHVRAGEPSDSEK